MFRIDKVESKSHKKSINSRREVSRYKSSASADKGSKKHNILKKEEKEDDALTFTVDSQTSQWDSDQSELEESDDADTQYENDSDDCQLLSIAKRGPTKANADGDTLAKTPLVVTNTKSADDMLSSKRKLGAAKRSYGRSHAEKYAKKKSARRTASTSKGKTVISLGISPTISFRTEKALSIASGFKKPPDTLLANDSHAANNSVVDDELVDSDESVDLIPTKRYNVRKHFVLDTSSESGESPVKKLVVDGSDVESDFDSEEEEF